jgi:PhoPQ-activated pathogenicity-related protein
MMHSVFPLLQLTMPKLIISTSGDEFLMPDNNDYYWDALQGEKHFHQFQNLEHSMAENIPLVLDTIRGFVVNLQSNTSRPNYFWSACAPR